VREQWRVRQAVDADLVELPRVEAAADELFRPLGITDLPAPASAVERARAWRVLVTGPSPAGLRVPNGGAPTGGVPTGGVPGGGVPGEGVGELVAGFAVLELLDGAVHLEQLSVDPGYGRRGIGAALLAATAQAARDAGADRVTLLTYADVPWNAPWYARHGWQVTTHLTPGLQALRRREVDLGLDQHGRRVAMVRLVT
jgi:hypothetical protein